MQSDRAHGAPQWKSYPRGRTGFRRLTPGLLAADRRAEDFGGLPGGIEYHGELLAALKAAAPCLSIGIRLVHTLDWLFRFTRPQDWEAGHQPIVWPSAALQQEALGLSESGVQSINRGLIEAGLIIMKDSPNGKRYGHRDKEDRIVEAYGFDLSPLAARYDEFMGIAAAAKAERELIGRLRRRGTIARKAIIQILETVTEYGWGDELWLQLRQDTQTLTKMLRRVERPEELTIAVGSLERRQMEARDRLEKWLQTVKTAPKGAEYKAHIIPTESDLDSKKTVHAHEECSGQLVPDTAPLDSGEGKQDSQSVTLQHEGQDVSTGAPAEDRSPTIPSPRLSIDDLVHLAPRLGTYLSASRPTWPDIINAADWLRGEMDISKSLWGEACLTMGREAAAVAVAIVSAKPKEHFRSSPGGYLHGMVRKAKAGELNLARTMWSLRQRAVQQAPSLAPSVSIGHRVSPSLRP